MSAVNPTPPPSFSLPPESAPFGTTPSGAQLNPADSLSSEDWLTLNTYLKAVKDPSLEFKHSLYEIAMLDPYLFEDIYKALGSNLADFIAGADLLLEGYDVLQQIQVQQNNDITTYNSYHNQFVQATQDLNTAINTYNQTIPSTPASRAAYSAAVQQYNSVVSDVTTTYNNATTDYNTVISAVQALDDALVSLGLPTISPVDFGTLSNVPTMDPDASPPVSALSTNIPTYGLVSVLPNFNPDDLDAVLETLLPQLAASIGVSRDIIDFFADNASAFQLRRNNVDDITLPLAYIRRIPRVFFSENQGAAAIGSGVGMTSAIMGLVSSNVKKVLATAVYKNFLLSATQPIPPQLQETLQLYTLQLLAHNATPAALAAAQQLAENTSSIPTNSQVFDITSALAFAANIRNLINSNVVLNGVARLIAASPDLSFLTATEKQQLAAPLASVVGLSLLGIALAQVSQVLGTLGLPAQLLANINGLLTDSQADTAALNAVLDDLFSVAFLKDDLAVQLGATQAAPATGGGSSASVNTTVNEAVNEAVVGQTFNSPEEVGQAVSDAFVARGTPAPVAAELGNEAVAFTETESSVPLDRPFSSSGLVLPPVRASGVVSPLEPLIATNPLFAEALRNAIGLNPETIREFRSNLIKELRRLEIPHLEAQHFLQWALFLIKPIPPVAEPGTLLQFSSFTLVLPPLHLPVLAEELSNHIIGKLKSVTDVFKARSLAEQAVRVLIGSNSILSTLNEQIRTLRDDHQNEALRAYLDDTIPGLTHANIPVSALTNKLTELTRSQLDVVQEYMSPVAQSNLMTSNPAAEPRTFKRDLDIRI